MPTAVQNSSDAFAWATRIIAVSLLAAVGTWVHQLGGVAAGAETAADGSISTDRMFNWHPVLMVLGFGVCMTEAVLAYRVPRGPNTQRWVSCWTTATTTTTTTTAATTSSSGHASATAA
jgi:hypothetical protein